LTGKIYWGKEVPDTWNGEWLTSFRTIPEKNGWKKTSSFLETCEYIAEMMLHSELMHVETMFVTEMRRAAPLVVLSSPRVSTPEEAKKLGKPVVYLQGGYTPTKPKARRLY